MAAEIRRYGTAMLFLKLVYAEGTESLADPHTDRVSDTLGQIFAGESRV
jgi:hypothetical protein